MATVVATPAFAGIFQQDTEIPVSDLKGSTVPMKTRVCRPNETAILPVVIINHGSPPDPDDRPKMKLPDCDSEAATWFLQRGYAVAFPLRLGYGATGGPHTEGTGRCDRVDYVRAGMETARQIDVVVNYMASRKDIDASKIIVLGQSAGGWGAIAYNSIAHPKVAGFINMAGGRGGHYENHSSNNCHPDLLIQAAGQFGRTATTPMLWVYTENDSFFGPTIAQGLLKAFTGAGGRVMFEHPDHFGRDGHGLFFGHGGSRTWAPFVERYLDWINPEKR